ncbi:MAG: methylated-DNA--[protein]-cysteine S-methyltransferase [Candidatus Gastranaerophilales bacterium]|nr:methylated-DNA--[protein]-cysteine S-methyltransferase [Candidatus Gastranaerophilales bacterium]
MKKLFYYSTPIGKVAIAEEHGFITNLFMEDNIDTFGCNIRETEVLKRAACQLTEYFNKERKTFDLPLKPKGSEFQNKVWKALRAIPYGSTVTYKELAAKTGNEKAARAVGSANNKNPIPLIIPCHRVIGSNGALVGFAFGLELKQRLLDIEKSL